MVVLPRRTASQDGGEDGMRGTKYHGLFVIELMGHLPTVIICCIAMAFAGSVSGFLESASYDAASISTEGLPGLVPSVILVMMALLPGIFVALGMYALIDASDEALRYEVGLYSSNGIDGYAIVDAWTSVYGWIPVLAYGLGMVIYFASSPGAATNLAPVLADVVSGLLLVAGLPVFILIPRRLYRILDESPYAVVRSG
jgi:hypothetical protein